ncbi:MAG: hypothetical protein ABI411_01245 [Tahibacter sp.]
MSTILRQLSVPAFALLLAACGKSADPNLPLAYVPADSPYVFANVEPVPKAVIEQWMGKMQQVWPLSLAMYQRMLDGAKDVDEPTRRTVSAILEEFKAHDSLDKLREIGIKFDAHMAIYGIGLIPVVRLELADTTAFKAAVSRIEAKAGAKLVTAKLGEQEYWQLGNDKLVGIAALIDGQLVLTFAPKDASEGLRKQLLGIERPAKSMLDGDALGAFNRQHAYLPYGSGYVDSARVVELAVGEPNAAQREFAAAMGAPSVVANAVCHKEFLDIAHKFPRLDLGYSELSAQRMSIQALLELEPALASAVSGAVGVAPGSGGPIEGIVDFSLAMPILKLKDFWLKQLGAAAAAPFACAELAELNTSISESKGKLDTTIPPPLSDLTGARISLSRFAMGADGKPDGSGKIVVGLTNPMGAIAMGQLAVPQLKDVKLSPDGKTVALPADLAAGYPPLFAAMSDKAIAIAVGKDEQATLSTFLAAPTSKDAVFMRMGFTGEFYGLLGDFMQKAVSSMPEEQRAMMAEQGKLFAFYRQWLRTVEINLTAKDSGIEIRETVEFN